MPVASLFAQLEPLLEAARVPATIVNWNGDQPVSVQQYCAYLAELLGERLRLRPGVEIEGDDERSGHWHLRFFA